MLCFLFSPPPYPPPPSPPPPPPHTHTPIHPRLCVADVAMVAVQKHLPGHLHGGGGGEDAGQRFHPPSLHLPPWPLELARLLRHLLSVSNHYITPYNFSLSSVSNHYFSAHSCCFLLLFFISAALVTITSMLTSWAFCFNVTPVAKLGG